jgi:diguanylate cyclase (GGDEF)-like protein
MVVEGSEFSEYLRRQVIEEGRALYFADLAEEPLLASQLLDPSVRSGALFPLRTGGENFGLLEAWHSMPSSLSEDDLGFLALLATIAGGLVKNARRLEHLLFVDPLTGVHTRGYFEVEFGREVERSNRNDQSLALLMIDVDDFKGVNDTHGHAAGDSALRVIAQQLKAHVRQVDVVTRYGGEEFAVLLPGATETEARRAAERLRSVVEAARIPIDGSRVLRLTISIGGALYPDHAQSREDLLDLADRVALLTAKRRGKNRVVFWSAELGGSRADS